jgi:bloom syndrome protein/3-oxo-5-alpha-steroid 4-dehydrogenase 1
LTSLYGVSSINKSSGWNRDYLLNFSLADLAHRPYQREIILAALEKKDVFVQAATSFGKSLCFQLPAVIDSGSMSFSQEYALVILS